MLALRKWKPFMVLLVLLICILFITICTNSGDVNLEVDIEETTKFAYTPRVNFSFFDPFCKRPTSTSLVIKIFVAHNMENIFKSIYKEAIASLTCYAKRRDYELIVINPFQDSLIKRQCGHLKNLFFLKHCAASVYLNQTQWLYVLDADTGVINFDRCLEDFVDARFDVIHHERFHNGEINAGNYIVRNSQFSKDYLVAWADLEAPFAGGNRNADNGALHYHILGYMDRNQSQVEKCRDMFRTLKSFDQYFNFVACVKRLMNGQRLFKEIKILRRGLGFVRDSWVTDHYFADTDFMLHAVKPPDNVHFTANIDVDRCAEPDWTLPVRPELKVDAATMTQLIRAADVRALKQRPNILLNVADVSDCWPKCPENISYNR